MTVFQPGLTCNVMKYLRNLFWPDRLLQVRERFEAAGGMVFENTSITGVEVYDDGVSLPRPPSGGDSSKGGEPANAVGPITASLLLDCMVTAAPSCTARSPTSAATNCGHQTLPENVPIRQAKLIVVRLGRRRDGGEPCIDGGARGFRQSTAGGAGAGALQPGGAAGALGQQA